MKYGLLGERLSHSYSRELHGCFSDDPYESVELSPDALADFFAARDFCAVNVTIPYKEAVMPLLDAVDETALAVGSVNTVVNRAGKLFGYNTDLFGLESLILRHRADFRGLTVLILGGDGGTARTAKAVSEKLGANKIFRVSRTPSGDMISYAQALSTDADVLINATPVGMFPHTDASPVDLSHFPRLSLVLDVIYHPLRSRLVLAARERGIDAEGGLFMLCAQGLRARELFTGETLPDGLLEQSYRKLLSRKENLVLIGMPGAGKTTVGRMLAQALSRPFVDTDRVMEEAVGTSCRDFIRANGEAAFRALESETVRKLTESNRGIVLSVGGGTPLCAENRLRLAENGRLIFLNRPAEALEPSASRPLSDTREKLHSLYHARHDAYRACADLVISGDLLPEQTLAEILSEVPR